MSAVVPCRRFRLQDTLGNAFAGLAIQIEKPFTWGSGSASATTRAASRGDLACDQLRTKADTFVVLPNNLVSRKPSSTTPSP